MNLQTIKSIQGKDEYVLLPIEIYRKLHTQIESLLDDDYLDFALTDYVNNPIALARIKTEITQEQLAKQMNVTQAYISKIEAQARVSEKTLLKFAKVLDILK
jgi:ribosome-binding protein aMBF1 (putative translation factor)